LAGNASSATISTSYSNYDAGAVIENNSPNGAGAITSDHQTNLVPGFVNAGAGNFHLSAGSPLIDAGDPANAPGSPPLDLDKRPRVIDGNNDFADRRDIGAYELPDTTAPTIQIDSGPTGAVAQPSPTYAFSSTDPTATFECRFDGAAFGPCSSPGSHTQTLTDGAHTFDVRALDHYANASQPASRSVTVDTVAPSVQIDSRPADITNDDTPTWAFSSSDPEAQFFCWVDDELPGPCTALGSYTGGFPSDGAHTFFVAAQDGAGNRGAPATDGFTVDTRAGHAAARQGEPEDPQEAGHHPVQIRRAGDVRVQRRRQVVRPLHLALQDAEAQAGQAHGRRPCDRSGGERRRDARACERQGEAEEAPPLARQARPSPARCPRPRAARRRGRCAPR
jgi:hypothetical protein